MLSKRSTVTRRVLVTGCRGQLGSDLIGLPGDRYEITGVDINDFDLCDDAAVRNCLAAVRPEIVLHAAAFTDVDRCESDEAMAMAINAEGTASVARACADVGALMVYYSTDYVFDGASERPYTEEDLTNPQTVYGRSKLAGEERVAAILDNYIILRLAWVYGYHGRNFVRTMIKLGWEQTRAVQRGEIITPIKVVNDQLGNPTWTADIVRQTEAVISSSRRGLFHATAAGDISWYGFAVRIFELLGMNVQVRPCMTEAFPRPALRPAYSSLANRRLQEYGLDVMRPWADALAEFLRLQKEALLACDVK